MFSYQRLIEFKKLFKEKYNIWVALLNLEYKFGSKESLERIFSQSINENKVCCFILKYIFCAFDYDFSFHNTDEAIVSCSRFNI